MRILFWSESFWPTIGGLQVFGAKLAPALQKRNCEVTVVTTQDPLDLPSEARYQGVPVHRFPFWTTLAEASMMQLREVRQRVARLKRTFSPDLVHMNTVGSSAFFHLQTAGAHPAPFLVTLHGGELPSQTFSHDTLLGQTLRRADWVTACSGALLAEARQFVPEIATHSSVIYNALDMPALQPEPLPSETPQLLCLGRLAEEKSLHLAVTAFASLRERFPHARLVIAGDGPARPELERQASELHLNEHVHFIGWVAPDQVPALLNTATVVVMPSRREGLPLVALEAALMARPVVATRVGGLPEVIVHQQTGVLVEPDDSEALAQAIGALLAHPERATIMGRAARDRVQKVFGWKRCVDAYETLYRTLIEEAAHADAAESPAPQ
jgi:glycogen(starch) synthase